MSNNNVSINIKVVADGSQAEAVADRIKKKMEQAFSVPTGARKAMTASGSASQMDDRNYNTARGLGGVTGAAGRDFAKQSQGLGGLVRLYATFAANLFAVSAAFTALKSAADTSNMVRGLDQLGASSGRALGSLSKQLVAATDGAISLRDAMSATALASAGGATNATILRMGEAAKKASQALGIAMPDALSRISRGVTKLEPELLDELGILVRVDKASQDYARSIGKSVTALTDFEKRQAFTNAVLDQAEKKFGAIKLETNPYDKLLASMQNIAQTGLELVNKVLTPILSILSSSPTALATAMALVGGVLLKQALPAIGSIKESLRESADIATAMAAKKATIAKAAQTAELVKQKDHLDSLAEMEADKVQETETKLAALKGKFRKSSKFAVGLQGMDSIEEAATIDNISKLRTNAANIEKMADREVNEEKKKGHTESARFHKEYAQNLEDYSRYSDAYKAKVELLNAELGKSASIATTAGQAQLVYDRAAQASVSRRISAAAAETASAEGFFSAVKKGYAEIKAAKSGPQTIILEAAQFNEAGVETRKAVTDTIPAMGKLRGAFTLASLSIGAATSALGTFFNAFGIWAAAIGIAVAAIQGIYNWASSAREAVEKFDRSLDGLNDSSKNLSSTLDLILSKDGSQWFSAESIQARANAFNNMADSIKSAVTNYEKMQGLKNWAENLVDGIYSAFGQGDLQLLAKGITSNVSKGLSAIEDPKLKKKYQDSLSGLLGGSTDYSEKGLIKAIGKLSSSDRITALRQIGDISKEIGNNLGNNASKLNTFISSIDTLDAAYKALVTSLAPTDPIAKLGLTGLTAMQELTKSLGDAQNAGESLKKLLNSPTVGLLPKKSQEDLLAYKKELSELDQEAKTAKTALESLKNSPAVKADLVRREVLIERGIKQPALANRDATSEAYQEVVKSQNLVNTTNNKIAERQKIIAEGIIKATESISEVYTSYVDKALKIAKELANIKVERTKLSIRSSYGEDTTAAERSLIKQEAAQKISSINEQENLALAQVRNTNAIEELTDTIREKTILDKIEASKKSDGEKISGPQLQRMSDELSLIASRRADSSKSYTAAAKGVVSGAAAQRVSVNADTGAALLQNTDQSNKKALLDSQKAYDQRIKAAELEKSLLQVREESQLSFSQQLSDESLANELKIAKLKYDKEEEAIAYNISKIDFNSRKMGELVTDRELLENSYNKEKLAITSKFAKENSLKISKQETLVLERNLELAQLQASKEESNRTLDRTKLEQLKELGAISEESFAKESAVLDKQKLSSDQILANQALEIQSKNALNALEANRLATDPQDSKLAKQYADEKTRLEALAVTQKSASDAKFAADSAILEITTRNTVEQGKFNDQLKVMQGLSESLVVLFGDMGSAIGNVGSTLLKMSQDDEKFASTRLQAEKDLRLAREKNTEGEQDSTPEEITAKERLAKLDKKQAKDQISNIANIAGASKRLFNDKSKSYKTLDGIEKAMHAYKMAMLIKEMGAEAVKVRDQISGAWAAAATSAAASQGVAVASTPAVLMKFVESMGWPGVAAGAAFVAAVLGGGGEATGFQGPSTEDIQKYQGTGMKYDAESSTFKESGGGVFGDAEAKSESIKNALEGIQENTIEGLYYDRSVLEALQSIDRNISGAAKSLYGNTAIRTGKGFGTENSSSSSGGGLLGSIFGSSSSSTSITNSGLLVQGTFEQLASGVQDVFKVFKDIYETSSSSGFLGIGSSSSSSQYRQTDSIKTGDPVKDQLTNIFAGVTETFTTLGTKLGKDVSNTLSSVKLNKEGSFFGLKGEELEKELSSFVSSLLDDVSDNLFGYLKSFANFNEGMLETVVRVIDENEKVTAALRSIGVSLRDPSAAITKESIAISDSLIRISGGISEFTTAIESYRDKFFTDIDKITEKQATVTKEFSSLNVVIPKTRTEFKALVNALDLTTEADQKAYVSLMRLSESFDSIVSAAEDLERSREGIASTFKTIVDSADSAKKSLDKARLSITQGYLNALKNVNGLQEETVDTMKNFAKGIRDFLKTSVPQGSYSSAAAQLSAKQNAFADNIAQAASGNVEAQSATLTLAKELIDYAKTNSRTQQEADRIQAQVSASLDSLATGKEAEVAKTYQEELLQWQQAISISGAATSITATAIQINISSLLEEYEKARLADVEASAALLSATEKTNGINLTLANSIDAFAKTVSDYLATKDALGQYYVSPSMPSFDVGSNYVPQDMVAQIHKGEKIVPATFNRNEGTNKELINELKSMKEQLARGLEEVARSSERIKNVLVRVTRDGESMQVAADTPLSVSVV